MRLAIFANEYPSEAKPYAAAYVHVRVQQYLRRGHRVLVLCLSESSEYYQIDGVEVQKSPKLEIRGVLDSFGADVLAIHAPNFRMIAVLEGYQRPMVSWLHGHEAMFNLHAIAYAKNTSERLAKIVKVVPRNLHQLYSLDTFIRRQSQIVFVSSWLRSRAQKFLPAARGRGVVVSNPIDTQKFTPAKEFIPAQKAVSIRHFNSHVYGFDVAIDAFSALKAAQLTLIGRGSLEEQFRRQIARTQASVTIQNDYVPHREMPTLLRKFGLFIAPSRRESQGVTIGEAMASGLPVIASRAGGIPEFIEHGRSGILVPPDDSQALRDAVCQIVRSPALARQLGVAARERMKQQCAPQRITSLELSLLQQACF